jgi:hypothetical protein
MRRFLLACLILIVLAPVGMYIAWILWPTTPYDILIIDKTVSTPERNEHRCFNWILTYDKYAKSAGGLYSISSDYAGFFPLEGGKYAIHDFDRLSATALDSLSTASDLIYVADTYGVYSLDWYTDSARAYPSRLLYGGLSKADLTLLEGMKEKKKVVMGEFNFFASPTPDSIRRAAEDAFKIHWTGWTGRYFESLDSIDNTDLPPWIMRLYRRGHGGEWPFHHSGIVLVNLNDSLLILEEKTHLLYPIPMIETQDEAVERFDVPSSLPYPYWFDIVIPDSGANVLAYYDLRTNTAGDSVLAQGSLRKVFPAVIGRTTPFTFYYFAGDFADNPIGKDFWAHLKGITWFRSFFYNRSEPSDRRGFFWKYYLPLVSHILEQSAGSRPPHPGS